MVEISHSTSNNSSIKAGQLAHSTPVEHLPFTLLSNSSFNYLSMYPQIPARSSSFDSRAPRSRTTTETSIGTTLTSYTIREGERNRMSADQRLQHARYLQLPGRQDGNGEKAKRVPAPQCPRVAERREGASLPRSPGMDDLAALLRAEETPVLSPPSKPLLHHPHLSLTSPVQGLFGTSNQRSRRLAKTQKTPEEIAIEKAKDEHLTMTMESLTFSPSTVESVSLNTPLLPSSSRLAQNSFPKSAAGPKTGLGLGYIGTQAIRPPASTDNIPTSLPPSPASSSHANRRFTPSTRAPSPQTHSRHASSHLDISTSRLEKRLTGSSNALSLAPSYYWGSQAGLGEESERGQSSKGSRAPSRLGTGYGNGNQDVRRMSMDMLNDSDRFAFVPPSAPSSPFIPFDFTKSPSLRPLSVSSPSLRPQSSPRRSPPTSPHKIKRKPVPSIEEWTLAVEEETRCKFDLPEPIASPRPQPQRVYMHERGAKSTPMFSTSIKPPTNSSPPLPTSKSANAVQTVLQSLKSFSVSYRSRSFGRPTEGSNSSTSISTGDSTELQTPRESYEDFTKITVKKQERSMGVAPIQVTGPTNGYTTRSQREAALSPGGASLEKKKKGRFAKMFAIQ
jgi:hypothetical protein